MRFLTETMKTSGSERVRMAAAVHLKDVLTLREQRDLAELRAAARQAEAQNEPATPGTGDPVENEPQSPADAERAAKEFLNRIKQRETQNAG